MDTVFSLQFQNFECLANKLFKSDIFKPSTLLVLLFYTYKRLFFQFTKQMYIFQGDYEGVDIVEGEDRNCDQNRPTTSTTSDNFKASCAPSDKVVLDIACCDGPIKFHRVTNQFYNPEKAMTTSAKEDVTASTCHKCNQAFSNELGQRFSLSRCQFSNASATNRQTDPSIPSIDSNADTKKKVENLQCYSCKTCGSKFPSYYFVHKHRKLHHQDTKEFLE